MADSHTTPSGVGHHLGRALQSRETDQQHPEEYRRLVKSHYDGPAGWFTVITGFFTGHESLAANLFGPQAFDVRGCKRILDAGCGNGRYLRFLLRTADADAELVGFDMSEGMLRRAHNRLRSERPVLLSADLTRLPYRDGSFDAAVCGWVLEHLPDPLPGLRELARVLAPGGKLLLMATETSLAGAICSRAYHCRTYTRQELRDACARCGLEWHRELWFSKLHRFFGAGGIVVELRRQ